MSKNDFDSGHHQPRQYSGKKKRRFNEESQDNRHKRINFKRYIQELEEEDLDDEIDEVL